MKIIDKLLSKLGLISINTMVSERGWSNVFGNYSNAAKEKVNNDTALSVSTFFACVRCVSEDVAKIPFKVYRKEGSSKYEVPEHPAYQLLQYQPNTEMTAMAFRESRTAQMLGWGNSYAYIEKDGDETVLSIYPLRPDRVTPKRTPDKELYYEVVDDNGQTKDIPRQRILHLHGLGFDGIQGYNVIVYGAQSFGSAMAADKYAGAYFGNGCNQQGNLEHPGNLSKEAQNRLRESIKETHSGSDKSHGILILEEGMKWANVSIDPKASQLIETRGFSVSDICRWCRVPPVKVADLSRATFSNIEQLNIDYVTDSLTGWMKRWEQECYAKLLTTEEKAQGYYLEHVAEGLLRGDVQTRYNAYSQAWDRGILTINEIRSKENMNPVDGGDVHLIPMNFTTLDKAGQQPEQNALNPNTPSNIDLTQEAIEDIASRIHDHEQGCLKDAKDLKGDKFDEAKFYEKFESKRQKYIKIITSHFGFTCSIPKGLSIEEIKTIIKDSLCITI